MAAAKPTHRVKLHGSALPGAEVLTLLSGHSFPRHSHDQFGIGLMLLGAQRSWSGIGEVESVAGDIITVNPGEMHDGAPLGGTARGWRIAYVDAAVIDRALEGELTHGFEIARPAFRDPILARRLGRLFGALTDAAPDLLAAEEALVAALMHVLRRHAARSAPAHRASPPVAVALRRIDEAPEAPVSLAELAALAGVSRFQLLRGFVREVGTTPHAYLVQRRVRLARRLLAQGLAPAAAALAAGFADQSHLTRTFVRQLGITPGRYRAALA